MKDEDLESFQQAKSPILLNPDGTTIADVIFQISLGSVEPGPIPREVVMKKHFETSDTYVLEWLSNNNELVKVLSEKLEEFLVSGFFFLSFFSSSFLLLNLFCAHR
jgi:hypothetical protein